MGRFASFLLGVAVGAAAVFGSLKYHVVRAPDGVHLVPKMSSEFTDTYVDVRGFNFSQWNEHRSLAAALVKAEKGHLIADASLFELRQSVDGILDGLRAKR